MPAEVEAVPVEAEGVPAAPVAAAPVAVAQAEAVLAEAAEVEVAAEEAEAGCREDMGTDLGPGPPSRLRLRSAGRMRRRGRQR